MDTGFQYDQAMGSAVNRHVVLFEPSGVNRTSEMGMMGHYYQTDSTATTSTRFLGDYSTGNNNSGFTQFGSSCGSVLRESGSGLKHDAGLGLAVDWSVEEQRKLEEGLLM